MDADRQLLDTHLEMLHDDPKAACSEVCHVDRFAVAHTDARSPYVVVDRTVNVQEARDVFPFDAFGEIDLDRVRNRSKSTHADLHGFYLSVLVVTSH